LAESQGSLVKNGLPRQRHRTDAARPPGKLLVPTLPGRVIQRGRLFSMLDMGIERTVTLVTAPAGSGKTMLLSSWLSARPSAAQVAWMSLDAGDNDPVRFWTHLLAACARAGVVAQDSDLLAIAGDAQHSSNVAPRLVERLDSLDDPVIVVLDDVHELTDPRVLAGMEFLVRHPPSSLRLVLSTRVDPPLPLHRLLLTGALSEIRAADLAFTAAEVAEMLDEYEYRPKLSEADVMMLCARTEGWAAGVRLAAVSMQDHPDPHRFVLELSGDDRSLAGYLVSEVLDRQSVQQRNFMIRTCIVNELSGPLADALTGAEGGEHTLARLAAANAFVMPMGERRGWYRYHPLFGELLRYELRREMPAEIGDLHLRAARWYVTQGLPVAAVEQMVMARDWHAAAELIATLGLDLAARQAWTEFGELVKKLPAEVVRTEPELACVVAAHQLGSGRDDDADYLRLACDQEGRVPPDRRALVSLLLALCRIAWARRVGNLNEVVEASHDALMWTRIRSDMSVAADSRSVTAVALSALADAELWLGRLEAAEEHLGAAQAAALWCGLEEVQVACLSDLSLLEAMTGRLIAALEHGQLAETMAGDGSITLPDGVGGALLAMAWAHHQRNNLTSAGSYLELAQKEIRTGSRWLAVAARILKTRQLHAAGDTAGAFVELRAARRLSKSAPPPLLSQWLATTETELHLSVGDIQSARRRFVRDWNESRPRHAYEDLMLAEVLLAEGDPDGALRIVSMILDRSTFARDPAMCARAWLLRGRGSHALGKTDDATAAVDRVIDLLEPEENRRVLLDAAPDSSWLLHYHNRIDSSWPFIDELLRTGLNRVDGAAASLPAVIEPLSQRERDVLGYLPSMLTFVEIGSELFISVNTTKSHVRSIYRKLGVVGRRDAVSRARQLHLLRS
jgi:LuxR family transcriptional regulator, maltose regulon positive regulatory protein